MSNTIKKRVEYKASVIWWDVELTGTFEGKYTARVIQPETVQEPFIDVFYNINGKVNNAVTNFDVLTAVRKELHESINNNNNI